MPWPIEKGEVASGIQKRMSIKLGASTVSHAIQVIRSIILLKEIPSRRQYEMT
jgi:hypothetical protein